LAYFYRGCLRLDNLDSMGFPQVRVAFMRCSGLFGRRPKKILYEVKISRVIICGFGGLCLSLSSSDNTPWEGAFPSSAC
jgi:hypothetical protein